MPSGCPFTRKNNEDVQTKGLV